MNSKTIKEAELLARLADPEFEQAPPDLGPVPSTGWMPSLNPSQIKLFEDPTRFILCYGERGSGKSIGALHKLVRHCYENSNALAVIVVGVKRQALEGGAWHKLIYDILPQWKAGLGIEFTESKTNTAKDDYLFMQNQYGGWSKILLLSMPVDNFIADRSKGLEPSFILVEEIQTLASDKYFSVLVQQLGRRPGIAGPQQYVATANPEGPSHWVYKRFFELSMDKETGKRDKKYNVYHIPISENVVNLPEGYYENVLEAVKDDPIEYRRMVLGEWVDRPTGDSIFFGYYDPYVHVKGDAAKELRLLPNLASNEIILGYDLGTANSAVVFMQNLQSKERDIWIIFDELVFTDAYIPYTELVPAIMRRMKFWNDHMNTKFKYLHVSDNSAFNQFRATTGTYDALEVARISQDTAPHLDVPSIELIECPKPPHSVPARVKLTMKLLSQDRLFVSDSCTRVKDTFMHLESEKPNDKKYIPDLPFQPRRSKYVHAFDALSYPLFYYALDTIHTMNSSVAKPRFIDIGVK